MTAKDPGRQIAEIQINEALIFRLINPGTDSTFRAPKLHWRQKILG